MSPKRILGVDYGAVRVGLSLSDESATLATPLEVVARANAPERIRQLVSEKAVGIVLIGMPRNMDGSYGPQADVVRQFAQALSREVAVEIRFWDERLTSRAAERMLVEADVSRKRRKAVVDKLAAQQMLQSYLDAQAAGIERGESDRSSA